MFCAKIHVPAVRKQLHTWHGGCIDKAASAWQDRARKRWMHLEADSTALRRDTGFESRTVFEDRIRETIRKPSCFLAHGEQVSDWAFFISLP